MQSVSELQQKQRREAAARLTSPAHILQNRFEEHKRIEGYFEDRAVPDFLGCDRLWKWDTLYGTVQMGYDPKRGQSFLFANIKTSIFDTAASQEQRKMNDRQRMGQLKTGNQNRAFSARRRVNSSVLLYKAENKPWGEQSIRPYLQRHSLEALQKTMPFLNAGRERAERRGLLAQDRALSAAEREARGTQRAGVRAERRELSRELDFLGSLVWRKQTQSRGFFRKLNIAFDLQKQKMFEYYRGRIAARRLEAENLAPETPEKDEKK